MSRGARCELMDLREPYRSQAAAQIRASVSAADVEQGPCPGPAEKDAAQENHARVDIHIHSIRKRLTDSDGLCAKWVIDTMVTCGILQDDSPKEVRSVTFSQEKGKPERTIVEIYEADDN